MKKSVAIAIISVLAVLALTLGVLYYTTFVSASEKTKAVDGLNETIAEKTEQIERLTADAADKAGQIETLTRDAAGRNGEIETLTAEAAEKAGQIETLTAELADKAAQIGSLAEEVAQRDGQIDTLNKLVSSKDEEIRTLTASAEDQAGLIDSMKAELADKAAQIETLTADVTDKVAQIEALAKDAADKDARIETLTAEAAEKAARIEVLTMEAAEKDAQIEALTKDAADKAAQIEEHQARIGEQEAVIKDQETVIAGKDQTITELQGKVDSLTAEAEGRAEDEAKAKAEAENQAKAETDPAPGTETRVGKKQSQPESAGERIVYTFGGLSVTMPASIRYDLGDKGNGQRFFADAENADEVRYAFLVMQIDIGLDVSLLDDAMKNIMLESIKTEIEKLETVRDCRFERTEILGNAALNLGFIFTVGDQEAPGYGTIIMKGDGAYVLFYAGQDLSVDEVKAEMLECIASIREEAGEPAPAETQPAPEPQPVQETQAPADIGNASSIPRFGMTKDELKAALGTWDEEEDFNAEYSIVRYQGIPFHGYVSTYAIVFRDGLLDTWMYGVFEDGMFTELENELVGQYGAAGENPACVIRVFKALNTSLTETDLKYMTGSGTLDYRYWHVSDDMDYLLMKLSTDSYTYSVLAYMKPEN